MSEISKVVIFNGGVGESIRLRVPDIDQLGRCVDALLAIAVASGEYVNYQAARTFAEDNGHSVKAATSTWGYLAKRKDAVNPQVLRPNESDVKSFLYTPSLVIDAARDASDRLNRPTTSILGFSAGSPRFLVHFANVALQAEPPIPPILRKY